MIANAFRNLFICMLAAPAVCLLSVAQNLGVETQHQLLKLLVSSSLDGSIEPGRYDKVQDLDSRLLSEVKNCRSRVIVVGRNWAKAHNLPIELDKEVGTHGQLLIWAREDKSEFYELIYDADLALKQATTSFNLFTKALAVDQTPDNAALSDLKKQLADAMDCKEAK